jgi:acetyltransferase-like isoleucine patch superfamily enzyme
MRTFLKKVADLAAAVFALPFYLWFLIESALGGGKSAFEGASQAVSLIPGTLGNYVRRAFYRWTLQRCSSTCQISFGVLFSQRQAEIGENVYLGANCDLGRAIIEDDVLLGSSVHVLSGKRQHFAGDTSQPIRLQGGEFSEVRIGNGAWIGNGAIVMANVGKHAIVGAGAEVTQDVEDYAIVAGNPATLIRKRTEKKNLSS